MELWHLPNEFRHWFWPPGGATSSIFNRGNNHDTVVSEKLFSHPFGLTRLQSDLAGIFLTIAGAIFASLGSIWEAYEETRNGPLSNMATTGGGYIQINTPLTTNKCSELFQLKFILGVLIWLFGAGLHVFGLLFAAASLLGPVNSAGLVATLWLSCALLNDELTWETWISSAGIVTGIAICLRASVNASNPDSLDLTETQMKLLTSWTDPAYLGFCVTILAFVILGAYCIHWLNRRRSELEWRAFMLRPQYDVSKRPMLGQRFQHTAAARELEEIEKKIQKQSDIAGILLAIIGGTCGSQTVCQIKEIEAYWTMTEFKGYGYLLSPTALWALAVLLVCSIVQYPLISSAYALADHATVSALYHVSWTLLSVIGGFVKFKEHRGSTGWEIMWFSVGLSLTLVSTFIAAKRTVEGIMNVMGNDILKNEWYMSGFSIAPIWNKLWTTSRPFSNNGEAGLEQNNNNNNNNHSVHGPKAKGEEVEMQGLRMSSAFNELVARESDDDYHRPHKEGGGLSVIESPAARSRSFDHTWDEEDKL